MTARHFIGSAFDDERPSRSKDLQSATIIDIQQKQKKESWRRNKLLPLPVYETEQIVETEHTRVIVLSPINIIIGPDDTRH